MKKIIYLSFFIIFFAFKVNAISIDDPSLLIYNDFNNSSFYKDIFVDDGYLGGAIELNGFSDEFKFKLPLSKNEDFSLSFWIRPDSIRREQEIINIFNNVKISISPNGFLIWELFNSNGKRTIVLGDNVLELNKWNHLVFDYDFSEDGRSISRIFLNGELDSIRTDSVGPIDISSKEIIIGGEEKKFDGKFDELIIFDRSLSNEEIKSLNEGSFTINKKKQCPEGFVLKEKGCEAEIKCQPFYSCSVKSSCINGTRTILCEDIRCGTGTKEETAECKMGICISKYECTEWTQCENGLSHRECRDINNCENQIDKPLEVSFCSKKEEISFSPDEFCNPDIQCGEWSECEYSDEVESLFSGIVRLNGIRERLCVDKNKCVIDFFEKEPCKSLIKLELVKEKIPEKYLFSPKECGKEYLSLYLNNTPVTYINIDAWRNGIFEASFVQEKINLCNTCFDAIKNGDEEGIDCGGSCKPCKKEKYLNVNLFLIPIAFFIILLSLTFVWINRDLFWKKNPLRKKNIVKS